MKCLGCYTEVKDGYCLSCRKKLFDKAKVSTVLSFDSPKVDNLAAFQEHYKRFSISGVQLKFSLRLENQKLEIAEKEGQYILKPIPPSTLYVALHDAPENEHLTMQIAAQLFKINTAANGLIYFKDGQPSYITRRFDVKPDGSKYMQEDFAQLTKKTKETHGDTFKYDGSYEEIGLLIKRFVAAAIPALEKFFQLIVFNYIISNGDAHLKNFSLFRNDAGEYQLTPAYDLMSTVIHTPLEADTALDLYKGDIESSFYSTNGYYGRENFIELAKRIGIMEKRAARIIDQFTIMKKQLEAFIQGSFLTKESKAKYLENVAEKITRIQPTGINNNYKIF